MKLLNCREMLQIAGPNCDFRAMTAVYKLVDELPELLNENNLFKRGTAEQHSNNQIDLVNQSGQGTNSN